MADAAMQVSGRVEPLITFDVDPNRYQHWKLLVDGTVATIVMDVNEEKPLRPGYKLKLNSYDLGVDIELHDVLQRIRFEHPQVRSVVLTSGKERIFCSGANIFMLAKSSHAAKVNFCKFTNETRDGIEDASTYSGLKFLAACNGTTAGGGYELALACDEIWLLDDRSSAVSLPEVPLLGVLPGTGGLTRLTDKRRVRRDHADIFCTLGEGVRAPRAREWRLIDNHAKPQQFAEAIKQRASQLAEQSDRPADGQGIPMTRLGRTIDEAGYHYEHVDVRIERGNRVANLTVSAPGEPPAEELADILTQGMAWWPLAMARQLDDAILMLRTNDLDIGTWIIRTRGNASAVLQADRALQKHQSNWFVREVIGMLRRTLGRLEVTSRTLFALIDPASCFTGTLLELALAADRSYMLRPQIEDGQQPTVTLSDMNFGFYPMVNRLTRLANRFYGDAETLSRLQSVAGQALSAGAALELGLVTSAPDDLDWDEEVRIAIEERASLSPDALTGMEANLRFGGIETMETRIFGRLSAWQNWVFSRPNAVGESGALKVFGSGNKAVFNPERV